MPRKMQRRGIVDDWVCLPRSERCYSCWASSCWASPLKIGKSLDSAAGGAADAAGGGEDTGAVQVGVSVGGLDSSG